MTGPAPLVRCSVCDAEAPTGDRAVEVGLMAWTRERASGRDIWICPACSRDHVRDIEAKLDRTWW